MQNKSSTCTKFNIPNLNLIVYTNDLSEIYLKLNHKYKFILLTNKILIENIKNQFHKNLLITYILDRFHKIEFLYKFKNYNYNLSFEE